MFARSKSIDLNYSLILINTLNTRLPHNLITQSHGDCFREYIEIINNYFLILTSNENNFIIFITQTPERETKTQFL